VKRKCLARVSLLALAAALIAPGARAAAVDDLLKRYVELGAANFSADNGEQFWDRAVVDAKSGEPRKCSLCHTTDLRRTGKHATTGKAIEPLAPSVNPKRLTDVRDIEKWLTRNCKWTLGRECTPQEKGDVLVMIRGR
jgi:putative intracellular protease/amidase